jgi:hypothetical protein
MNELYNRLSVLKMILNSSYGVGVNTTANVYEESFKIREKINVIKSRKEKIKRIFNGVRTKVYNG